MTEMDELVVSWEMDGDRPVRAVLELADEGSIEAEVPQWPPQDWSQDEPHAVAEIVEGLRQQDPGSLDGQLAEILDRRGAGLWSNLFPGDVGRAILERMNDDGTYRLVLRTDNDYLLSLPLEAAQPPGEGPPIGLDERLEVVRRVSAPQAQRQVPPAPLRIVTVLQRPDEPAAQGAMLDRDAEEELLLDVLETPITHEGTIAEFVDEGQLSMVAAAVERRRPQVLHISGRAASGQMVFETAEGGTEMVAPERLAEALTECDSLRLVIGGTCVTGADASPEPIIQPGIAKVLVGEGVPAVIALHAAVTEEFAAWFLDALYTELAVGQTASGALAWARRKVGLEKEGEPASAQWVIPVLFEGPGGVPVWDLDTEQLPEPTEPPSHWDGISYEPPGEFIGRRDELRAALNFLRGPGAAGYIWHGSEGVGKTTLCTQVAQRLIDEDGYLPVIIDGEIVAPDILVAVYEQLGGHAAELDDEARAEQLQDLIEPLSAGSGLDEEARWECLRENVLRQVPVVIIFDRFDEMLVGEVRDPLEPEEPVPQDEQPFRKLGDKEVDNRLRDLLGASTRARLLFTSRYPFGFIETQMLFGVEQTLLDPLSENDARKLMFSLEHLRTLWRDDEDILYQATGGHPLSLEYLDAVLQDDASSWHEDMLLSPDEVLQMMREGGVDVERGDTLLREITTLAAHDGLVQLLLQRLEDTDAGELLYRASVYRKPVGRDGLEAVAGRAVNDEEIELLQRLRLLRHNGGRYVIPIGTAEEILTYVHDEVNEAAQTAAAGYWQEQVREHPTHFGLWMEIRSHFLNAAQYAEAWLAMFNMESALDAHGYDRAAKEVMVQVRDAASRVGFAGAQIEATFRLGNRARDSGQLDQALEHYIEGRELCRMLEDDVGEAKALARIGSVYERGDEPKEAIDHYQRALKIFRRHGNQVEEADTLRRIGMAYLAAGDEAQAIGHCKKALQQHRQLQATEAQAFDLLGLGAAYASLAKPETAIEYYEQALDILRGTDQVPAVVETLAICANIYSIRAEPRRAVEYYQEALRLAREMGYEENLYPHLLGLAEARSNMGQWEGTAECYEQAAKAATEAGDVRIEAAALKGLATTQKHQGQWTKAMETYHEAMREAEKVGETELIAEIAEGMAAVRHDADDLEQAVERFEQALGLYRSSGNRDREARALVRLGNVCADMDEYDTAISHFKQALEMHRELNNDVIAAGVLVLLGQIYAQAGEANQSVQHLHEAVEAARQTDDEVLKREADSALAEQLQAVGRLDEARDASSRALALALQNKDFIGAAWAATLLGGIYEETEQPKTAMALTAFAFARFYEREPTAAIAAARDLGGYRTLMGEGAFADALGQAEDIVAEVFTDIGGSAAADMARPLQVSPDDIPSDRGSEDEPLSGFTENQLEQLVAAAEQSGSAQEAYRAYLSVAQEHVHRDSFDRARSLLRRADRLASDHGGADLPRGLLLALADLIEDSSSGGERPDAGDEDADLDDNGSEQDAWRERIEDMRSGPDRRRDRQDDSGSSEESPS